MDFPIRHISPRETELEISKLSSKKAPGYDKIAAKDIKLFSKKAIIFLTLIYNSILRLYHFPSQWKCAEIVMVPKPNKPENVISSIRPISLLCTLSKIFEKLFLKRLKIILDNNKIIPDYQFGFRLKHGTPEQCHRIVKVVRNALETKKYCSAIFLDVKQAFDRVWHPGLLYKLKYILPAPFYMVLMSYLKDRHFYVRINNSFSEICDIKSGIPQGSVLGPVLYTIYTSDMPIDQEITTATYADDTAIIACNNNPTEASRILQSYVDILSNWFKKWNICVNPEKSSHITFALRKSDCPAIHIDGQQIPSLSCIKYLGMHLDRRLTWKDHVRAKKDQLNKKTKQMYWLLGRNSELSLENKILLYKTILKPVWTYGIELWGTASNSNVEILQRYQSKTLRMIVNAPWYVTNDNIHKDLFTPKVKQEISRFSSNYLNRLSYHPNVLAISLLDDSDEVKRLKRFHVLDLPFRN